MQLSQTQWLAAGAAAVLVSWPYLRAALERVSKPTVGGKPKPADGGGRPAIVSDVLDLQDSARRLGNQKAAELLGQAAVALIESKSEARR